MQRLDLMAGLGPGRLPPGHPAQVVPFHWLPRRTRRRWRHRVAGAGAWARGPTLAMAEARARSRRAEAQRRYFELEFAVEFTPDEDLTAP